MEQKFCQSCAMPLTVEADQGTNAEYCTYCFREGKFTAECTMDQMIDHCSQFVDEFNKGSEKKMSKEEAIAQMKMYFPQLKRWAKA